MYLVNITARARKSSNYCTFHEFVKKKKNTYRRFLYDRAMNIMDISMPQLLYTRIKKD